MNCCLIGIVLRYPAMWITSSWKTPGRRRFWARATKSTCGRRWSCTIHYPWPCTWRRTGRRRGSKSFREPAATYPPSSQDLHPSSWRWSLSHPPILRWLTELLNRSRITWGAIGTATRRSGPIRMNCPSGPWRHRTALPNPRWSWVSSVTSKTWRCTSPSTALSGWLITRDFYSSTK